MAIDEGRLNALMGKMVGELGAIASSPLVVLGDRLGVFRAMAGAGPLSADALADSTGIRLRYAQEWLNAMAASGYVDYDAAAMVFADEQSPACLAGGFEVLTALFHDIDKVQRAFPTGTGLGWHEHHPLLFSGTERFFRAGYNAHLVPEWIPALEGAEARLRARARQAGVDGRVRFETAGARDYPGKDYDPVAFFDCLHDMGDPVGAGRHVRETLAPDGTWMIVEPFAGDTVAENMNPVGRVYCAASTMVCTPCSLSQEVGLGLGAQAGEGRLHRVAQEAGFGHFRRASETPFNLVFEARA
jgi:hypothetical protein